MIGHLILSLFDHVPTLSSFNIPLSYIIMVFYNFTCMFDLFIFCESSSLHLVSESLHLSTSFESIIPLYFLCCIIGLHQAT